MRTPSEWPALFAKASAVLARFLPPRALLRSASARPLRPAATAPPHRAVGARTCKARYAQQDIVQQDDGSHFRRRPQRALARQPDTLAWGPGTPGPFPQARHSDGRASGARPRRYPERWRVPEARGSTRSAATRSPSSSFPEGHIRYAAPRRPATPACPPPAPFPPPSGDGLAAVDLRTRRRDARRRPRARPLGLQSDAITARPEVGSESRRRDDRFPFKLLFFPLEASRSQHSSRMSGSVVLNQVQRTNSHARGDEEDGWRARSALAEKEPEARADGVAIPRAAGTFEGASTSLAARSVHH